MNKALKLLPLLPNYYQNFYLFLPYFTIYSYKVVIVVVNNIPIYVRGDHSPYRGYIGNLLLPVKNSLQTLKNGLLLGSSSGKFPKKRSKICLQTLKNGLLLGSSNFSTFPVCESPNCSSNQKNGLLLGSSSCKLLPPLPVVTFRGGYNE